MRREALLQRGQLAVSAVVWAVTVSTWALWLTAVIAHPGTEQVKAVCIKAERRIQGQTTGSERWHSVVYPEHASFTGARKLRENQLYGVITGNLCCLECASEREEPPGMALMSEADLNRPHELAEKLIPPWLT